MFIAMNHFQVAEGREHDFEAGWQSRESYLAGVPGFIEFALLKGDEPGEYASHTVWESRDAFLAWAQSDAFRRAHSHGLPEGTLKGHPRARFWDAVMVENRESARA